MKISKGVLKVIEIIRKESKKPRQLPKLATMRLSSNSRLRFIRKRGGVFLEFCPMGLCKKAKYRTPFTNQNFPYKIVNKSVEDFARWWDKQTNAREAVDAVWGK